MPIQNGARTSFEQAVLDRQKVLSGGNKDYKITPDEYQKLAVEFFGNIADKLPKGSEIVQQISPTEVIYKGPDGKQYQAKINTNSDLGIDIGRVDTTLLDSPIDSQSAAGEQDQLAKLLPSVFGSLAGDVDGTKGDISSWLTKLMGNADALANTKGFVPIDDGTRTLLDTITAAQDAKLNQQFGDEQGKLISSLYGRGINKSNLAGQEANRLSQGHGLVQQQANADAANRELTVQQFLTQALQGNRALAGEQYTSGASQVNQNYNSQTGRQGNVLNFVNSLLQQALQRETSGVSLGQGQQQIDNQASQFDRNYGLAQSNAEVAAAAQRHASRMAVINGIVSGITGAATSLFAPQTGIFGKSG